MRTIVGLGFGVLVAGLMSAGLAVGCGNGDDDDTLATGSDGGTTSDASGGGGTSETAGSVLFNGGGTDNNGTPTPFDIVGVFGTGSVSGSGGGSPCGAAVNGCKFCQGAYDAGTTQVSFTAESAGTLTVDDGTAPLATLSYTAAEGIYDSSQSAPSITWNAGDLLHVSASGSAFPAFTASVTAPAAITSVSPALDILTPITVPSSAPFTISWAPLSDSATVTLVIGVAAENNSTLVSCTAEDSAGTITVAASLLAQLAAAGDPGGTITLQKAVTSQTTLTGGATLSVSASPVDETGTFTF